MWHAWRYSFRTKLLALFLIFAILPLAIVTLIVNNTVQKQYTETLATFFNKNVELQEKNLLYYLESNKTWIKSIAAQDIIVSQVEKYSQGEEIDTNGIFASLVSIRRENPFIEQIYIVNTDGNIIISSTTDDVGKPARNQTAARTYLDLRTPHYSEIATLNPSTRVLPLTAPFLRRSDSKLAATLVVEYNTSIIKSLIEGNLYTTQSINKQGKTSAGEIFVLDENGTPLTNLNGNIQVQPRDTVPYQSCNQGKEGSALFWRNYQNIKVYGSFRCKKIDDLIFTFVVYQPESEAFAVSTNLRNTIVSITVGLSLLVIISIIRVGRSITKPIKKLQLGASELGKGNFDYKLDIQTHDEIEDLGNAFNEMANRLKQVIVDLKSRDVDLYKVNSELSTEKETISAERNMLEIVMSGITDAVIALNKNNEIIIFNKAAQMLTNIPEVDALGKPIESLITFSDDEHQLTIADYCPTNSEVFEGVIYQKDKLGIKTSTGKEGIVNIITGKIKEGDLANLGAIITLHDITSEAELEEMKLDFVSMAAHELRTPITSIRGYASVLGEEMDESKNEGVTDWKTLVDRISISAEQLLALVENMLNVTKIEKGILSINTRNEQWGPNVVEVADIFKERAKNKKIMLIVKEIDPRIIAFVDKLRINEVISNLISNAINYTQEGGTITVESHPSADGTWIETSVVDNGQGIPKNAQNHLFEKFFRVTGKLEQGSKGNGLGLYISKSIVLMHGGKIWVESDAGKGARFIFTVPKAG
ncbi:MAG: ATP-binding protein [bacterium]|nr:ATP-binding protein [bacterium]